MNKQSRGLGTIRETSFWRIPNVWIKQMFAEPECGEQAEIR